ncbi:MAG: hypothetical protein AAF086_01185 [Planctomycetota bacterium]
MRRLVDLFVVLVVIAVAVFVVQSRRSVETSAAAPQEVQQSIARLYERASYYGALETSTRSTRTLWPVAIMPEWFGGTLPSNTMLSDVYAGGSPQSHVYHRPWIDVAPPGDDGTHPPDPVAVRRDQAQFWYNPNVGLFRARVPAHLGEDQALSLYNLLNGVNVAQLHRDTDPARTPLAYTPGTTPSATHASREPTPTAPPPMTAKSRPTMFMSDPSPNALRAHAASVESLVEPEPIPAPAPGPTRLKDQRR